MERRLNMALLDEILSAIDSRLGKLTGDVARIAEQSKPKLLRCEDGKCGFTTESADRYIDHRLDAYASALYNRLAKEIKPITESVVKEFTQAPEFLTLIGKTPIVHQSPEPSESSPENPGSSESPGEAEPEHKPYRPPWRRGRFE